VIGEFRSNGGCKN
jgi:hypothetical protein